MGHHVILCSCLLYLLLLSAECVKTHPLSAFEISGGKKKWLCWDTDEE